MTTDTPYTADRRERETAVKIALLIHDEAMATNRVHGFEMFDVSAMPLAFIQALEVQEPSFTVAPSEALRLLRRCWTDGDLGRLHAPDLEAIDLLVGDDSPYLRAALDEKGAGEG